MYFNAISIKQFTLATAGATHRALPHALVWGVEEEGAEQGHTGAVVQHCQVGLGELESRWALLLQLPRGVQEQQEHGSLADTR